jgi:uncharacterized membrane protein (Fun14 family)
MNVFKAVFYTGIDRWLDDKATMRKRLIYWPLAIPTIFFVVLSMLIAVNTLRTGQNGDMSSVGGVVVALEDNNTGTSIANVLGSKPTVYEHIFVSKEDIAKVVQSKQATFGLFLEDTEEGPAFVLIYDKTRNYPHKRWIEDTQSRLNELNIAIKRDLLTSFNVPLEQRAELLRPLSIDIQSFGSGNSVDLIVGLMLVLWTIMFIYPLECTKSIYSSLFIEDVTHDLLPLWLSARAKKYQIILGRMGAGMVIFSITLLVMTLYVGAFASLFYYLIDILITRIDAAIFSDPNISPFTIGYLEFIDGLTSLTLLKIFFGFLLLGFTALTIMLPGTIYAKSTEQSRTNNMLIDLGLSMSPIMGFVVGYAGPSFVASLAPIFGTYHVLLSILAGDTSMTILLGMLSMNCLLMITFFYFAHGLLCNFKRTNQARI